MEDFSRTYTPIDFGENNNSPIEIVLKYKDDFEGTWERNDNNTLRFGQVKQLLAQSRICYFQKQKSDERNHRPRHKIYVPIDDEKAIELSVSLSEVKDSFPTLYFYFAGKSKEIAFIQPPQKDVCSVNCRFHISPLNHKDGTNSQSFIELCKTIESLNIPTIDINKEKDKKIWDNYVNALKKLVKQKENVWKIQKVSQTYTEINNVGERATYVYITISEDDLNKKFDLP